MATHLGQHLYDDELHAAQSALLRPQEAELIPTSDGWLVNPETGEIVRGAFLPSDFKVEDLNSASLVLERMQRADAQILAFDAQAKAILANLEKMKRTEVQKRAWLDARFGQELKEFAYRELDGKKARSIQTFYGTLAFRKTAGRIAIAPDKGEQALEWARETFPQAVKTTESLLVSELKGSEDQLPMDLFEVTGPGESFSIKTEVKP